MPQLKILSPGFRARRDTTHHLIKQAGAALLYLGIGATFATFSFVAWLIWLLIW
jgi:hypothetical protein